MQAARRGLVVAALVTIGLSGCITVPAKEQRTTQGPTAEQLWMFRVTSQNGRQPTFEERQHWLDQLDARISRYLIEHPAVANSFEVSTFRHLRQASVGMSKEQVRILLGSAHVESTDAAEMEKLARRYWTDVKARATEVWVYPLGWRLYFSGPNLVDITQYVPERSMWGGPKESTRAAGAAAR